MEFSSKINTTNPEANTPLLTPTQDPLRPIKPQYEGIEEIEDDISRQFREFKRFFVVPGNPFDHYFVDSVSITSRNNSSCENILQERGILHKHLPSSIYVRAYEERIDLMRAVIVGLKGTPYHNCLFFFDIQYPYDYPKSPPKLHYYSNGLSLSPNLRVNGEVSVWHGKIAYEKWNPSTSTVLSYLVSIQDSVLNSKPYFNKPFMQYREEGMSKTLSYLYSIRDYILSYKPPSNKRSPGVISEVEEEKCQAYNKEVALLSFKAMLCTLRNPRRNFREFIGGHFRNQSHEILMKLKEVADCDGEGKICDPLFLEVLNALEQLGSYCAHFLVYLSKDQREKKDEYEWMKKEVKRKREEGLVERGVISKRDRVKDGNDPYGSSFLDKWFSFFCT